MVRQRYQTRTSNKGASAQSGDGDLTDADLSVEELKKLPIQVLRLMCRDLKVLQSGKKKDLAERVYDKYHPQTLNPPPHVELGDEEDTLPYDNEDPPPPASDEEDREAGDEEEQRSQHSDGDERTDESDGDDGDGRQSNETESDPREQGVRNPPPPVVDIHQIVQAVVEQSLGEQVRTMTAQVQALHSQVTTIKRHQAKPTLISTATPNRATRTSPRKRPSSSSDKTNRSPAKKARRDQDVKSTSRSGRTTTSSTKSRSGRPVAPADDNRHDHDHSNNSGTAYFSFPSTFNPPLTQRNKFRLPAIDRKYLDLIEKGDYVDFDKMKKKKADTKSREANQADYNLKLDESASDSTTLRLKKSKKDVITNYSEWMAVWNDFLHARLHFHPEEAYELLKYQKHITDFSKLYKFEAVKSYDIDFRHLLANEKSVAPIDRTAFWDQQNAELKNLLLVDNPKPPPHCYNCNEKGHISSDCPKPSKKQANHAKNQNNNSYGPPTFQNFTYPQSYTPSPRPPPPPPPPSRPPMDHTAQHATSAPPGLDVNDKENYCRALNTTGACPRGFRCKWLHYCNKCKFPGHGGVSCLNFTSTPFRG